MKAETMIDTALMQPMTKKDWVILMETYARAQIEKDRENLRNAMDPMEMDGNYFNILEVIDDTPIILD